MSQLQEQLLRLTHSLPVDVQDPVRSLGKKGLGALRRGRRVSAGVLRRVGERLDNAGHGALAFRAVDASTRLNPENFPAWIWLARLNEHEGNYPAAALAYAEAIQLRPFSLAAYGRRANAQQLAGDDDGARLTGLAGMLIGNDPADVQRLAEQLHDPESSPEDHLDALMASNDPVVARATAEHLMAQADPDVTAEFVQTRAALLDGATARRAVESVFGGGAVRASLVAAEAVAVEHPSAWVDSFIARRTREVADLDAGFVALRKQSVSPVSPGDTTAALYLLHNSLPYKSGGYATRTHGLLSGMKALGHPIVGVTRPGFPSTTGSFSQRRNIEAVDVIDNIRYERLISQAKVLPRRDLDAFAEHYARLMRPIVESHRPAIIHAASNWWNGYGGLATAQQADVPFIYEVRGLWELTKSSREPEWSGSEAFLSDALREASVAQMADRVVTISGALRNELISRGVEADKIVLAPNAVDTERFAPRPRDERLATDMQIADKVVIGFAGTVTFYEGLDLLLRAVADMPVPVREKTAVLIIGSGPALKDLQALVLELGLERVVRFVGRVDHALMPRYLSLFDIVPFPRLPIPVCEIVPPIKPLEAMSMSKAVVVSTVQALAETIIDGSTGLHCNKGDVDDLRKVLERLIEDAPLRENLGAAAREWTQQERSWHRVTSTLATTYAELKDR